MRERKRRLSRRILLVPSKSAGGDSRDSAASPRSVTIQSMMLADALTAVGAIGSALAAGAAVYVGVIRPYRRRPKLTVGEVEKVTAETRGNGSSKPTGWLRAPIRNARNRDAAEDVQVILRSVKSGASAEQLTDRELGGFALMWTAIDDAKALLPPGVSRYINIGYEVKDEAGATEPKFKLDLHKPPCGERPVWSCALAEIEIVIAARNANAVSHRFCIKLENDEARPC